MRPANIVTAAADVLAGITIAGYFSHADFDFFYLLPAILLIGSTKGLYGGGVVFNDVFDAELDKIERPERPIPSRIISKSEASTLGIILLAIGIGCASFVNSTSLLLAIGIAVSSLVYDKWGKHQNLLGPVNMGLCRGLNLLLGISIIPEALNEYWPLAFIPIIYIASITMISRGEVHGGKPRTLYFAAFLYIIVITAILFKAYTLNNLIITLPILVFFAWLIFTPLKTAINEPVGKNIGKAVKAGVLALIIMNAGWAAAFGSIYSAIIILVLLPLSIGLARMFAVT
jgi:4-hydroxybenzoate polyprenyltransferase